MNIVFDKNTYTFRLDTNSSSYMFQVVKSGYLCHIYWGGLIGDISLTSISKLYAEPYNPQDEKFSERPYQLRFMPQEFSCYGITDYRVSSIKIEAENGTTATDFRYIGHEIIRGKPEIEGLPSTYANSDEAMTLKVFVRDFAIGIDAILWYTVFDKYDVLTRRVTLINTGTNAVKLNRLYSTCVDFPEDDYDILYLYGSWANEANVERVPVPKSVFTIQSNHGISSREHNPFFALCAKDSNEHNGDVYGFSLVYSGSFSAQIEADAQSLTRVIMGLNPENFSWCLKQGESFSSPEVVMVYSKNGFNGMSQTYHKLYRNNLCNGKWQHKLRPILINSWESFFFDFNKEKLLNLAKESAELGIDLFVLDDGWFADRNNDKTSLGDWYANEIKLGGNLTELASEIKSLGLSFGLWIEPEAISKNSKLYECHPDWCLHCGDRPRSEQRNQLVLDFSRIEVVDYIISTLSNILESAPIDYVKWDMNRSLSEVGSCILPKEEQGEVSHRYVLGLYHVMDVITKKFPDILFEGCCGGGGRFDPGILYYMPQIWASDNTDAIDRLTIHYGETMVYPLSCISAHVSAVPNLQSNRTTPLKTRFHSALTGSFGYELDICNLGSDEKMHIKKQITEYKSYQKLITEGNYYRLISPLKDSESAWIIVSEDKKEALVGYFRILSKKSYLRSLKLAGLDSSYRYLVIGTDLKYYGSTLMSAGITLPKLWGDYTSYLFHLRAEE